MDPQATVPFPAPEGENPTQTDAAATPGGPAVTPMRRLGRGLNALLGGAGPEPNADDSVAIAGTVPVRPATPDQTDAIHVELIEKNPFQPRKAFGEEELDELAHSITTHGVLQPLLVRPHDGSYQLIAGERRLMAAKRAGLETVPCRVLEVEDRLVAEVAIEENLKRKDLDVLEKAQAFRDYIDRFDSSIDELAKNLGLKRPTVSNYLRLLDLGEPAKKALKSGDLTGGHARAVLPLEPGEQKDLVKRIKKEGLSVRAVEAEVRRLRKGEPEIEAADEVDAVTDAIAGPEENPNPDVLPLPVAEDDGLTPHLRDMVEQLKSRLGTDINLKLTGGESGVLTIKFDSNAAFERICGVLSEAA
ncbi:MAG: ParB/RepB/Spo0J family partition protein [Planctomycetota bacterium]